MALAMQSFPVPVSPSRRTVASVAATTSTFLNTLCSAVLCPIMFEKTSLRMVSRVFWFLLLGAAPAKLSKSPEWAMVAMEFSFLVPSMSYAIIKEQIL
jgi:hypothetical protein